MIIGVDGTPLQGKWTPQGRRLVQLLNALSHILEEDKIVVWMNQPSDEERARVSENRFVKLHVTHYPWAALRMTWGTLGTPAMETLIGETAQVYFFASPWHPPHKRGAHVVMLEDLTGFLPSTAGWVKMEESERERAKKNIQKASILLTPSEWNRAKFPEAFGVDASKVWVIPPGVASCFEQPVSRDVLLRTWEKYSVKPPYFLVSGCLEPRKNVLRLIHAFLAFRQKEKEPVTLVLAGSAGAVGKDFLDFLTTPLLQGKVAWLGEIPQEDLPPLAAGATALLDGSLSSGFGLSIVEALRVGCPAAVSRIPVFLEILGDAVFTVEATDVAQWVDALRRFFHDDALKKELSAKGKAKARLFSWENSARQTLSALRAAAARTGN